MFNIGNFDNQLKENFSLNQNYDVISQNYLFLIQLIQAILILFYIFSSIHQFLQQFNYNFQKKMNKISSAKHLSHSTNKKSHANQSQSILTPSRKYNMHSSSSKQNNHLFISRNHCPEQTIYLTTTKNQSQKHKQKLKATKKALSKNVTPNNNLISKSSFTSMRNSCIPNMNYKTTVQKQLNRDAFKFLQKIGSGGFGQVWKVEFKKNMRSYAMKEISKAKVILKKSVHSILNEKQILKNLYNPLIINMKCSFQDRQNLYLVLDYLTGGDLRYHLCSKSSFSEQQSKFIIACIVLSLEYIHENNIIHRDLKPQNLVFQNSGYIRITDFGIARKRKQKNANETSGTPGYMSPEVICRLNHSFEADYFALGVIAYQFMLKKRPYVGNSRKQIREHILAKQISITRNQIPKNWSLQAADFINKLIQRKREARLGFGGINEIKKHPWLLNINWERLKNKEYRPPFVPKNLCQTNQYLRQIQFSEISNSSQYEQQRILLRSDDIQDLFSSYNEIGSFKMYYNKQSTKSTFYTYCQYQ